MSRMARIPTYGTRPERLLIDAVRRVYDGPLRTQVVGLPGTPDLLLPAPKLVMFAMGCFWHGHELDHCPTARVPLTGFDWARKFSTNRKRDARNRADLIAAGYRVAWVWECGLVGAGAIPRPELDERIANLIAGGDAFTEIEGKKLGMPSVAA